MSFWPSQCFSNVCLRMNIASVVLLPGINPNWLSWISVHSLNLLSTTFSHILKVCVWAVWCLGNSYTLERHNFLWKCWPECCFVRPMVCTQWSWFCWKVCEVSPLPNVPCISIPPLVYRRCPQPCHTSSRSVLSLSLPHWLGSSCPGWTPCPRSPLVDSFIHEPVEILAPSPSDVFIFHQHLSCCTFDGSNLSNVLSCSVPSRCDRPYTHYY